MVSFVVSAGLILLNIILSGLICIAGLEKENLPRI
ncbi:hypothetical protein HGR_05264 [Hylemonella gracilis ATCC 19624]|uniref:Uncharacterized protein n=1 Tax=Hylemonella gracilis ATCC 19624 TaxID=887062 RepID=F3KRH4_9BURK|nr:hypothetical protein HGR_05264 [Hylemonella gracilis ATCC 19624]